MILSNFLMDLYSTRLTKRIRSSGDVTLEAGSDVTFKDATVAGPWSLSGLLGGALLIEKHVSSQDNVIFTNTAVVVPGTSFKFVHPGADYGNLVLSVSGSFNVAHTFSANNGVGEIILRRTSDDARLTTAVFTHNNTSSRLNSCSFFWTKEYAPGETDEMYVSAVSNLTFDTWIDGDGWGLSYRVHKAAALSCTIEGFNE